MGRQPTGQVSGHVRLAKAERLATNAVDVLPEAQARRPPASGRGYGADWRKTRAAFLAAFPVCVDCGAATTVPDHDPVTRAELVRRGDPDPDAWHHLAARCAFCHNRRTAETVGFGR